MADQQTENKPEQEAPPVDQMPDIENQVPGPGAPCDNSMEGEIAQEGVAQGQSSNPAQPSSGQNHTEFEQQDQSEQDERLPPISSKQERKQQKAAQKAAELAQRLEAIRNMTYEDKRKELDNYNPQEYYYQDQWVDATDTAQNWLMAKIINVVGSEVEVSYDGWSSRWDACHKKRSRTLAPFRARGTGYSGQTKLALREDPGPELSFNELRFHRKQIEWYLQHGFEGRTAHQTTQYLRGSLFVYIDHLLSNNFEGIMDKASQDPAKHPFEIDEIQDLLRATMRLICALFVKITTMPKILWESQQCRDLYLVDPQHAILQCYNEFCELLGRILAIDGRNLRYYIQRDSLQLPPYEIKKIVAQNKEQIVENTFGAVVQDYTEVNFIKTSGQTWKEVYSHEDAKSRALMKHNLVFGTLCNLVQYFADIGGFDAIINLLKFSADLNDVYPEESKIESQKKEREASAIRIPFCMMQDLCSPFTHIGNVLTQEFSDKYTKLVSTILEQRMQGMSEKDIKEVDKDEIAGVLPTFSEFFRIGMTPLEGAAVVERSSLYIALRFLKSENLEKRLKGLNDIRYMVDRVQQLWRYERFKAKSGGNAYQYKMQYESRFNPSKFMNVETMSQWLLDNQVLEIILGGSAHIEIVKRAGMILKFVFKYGEGKFDDEAVNLLWKAQEGKFEDMVRAVYNLIEEVQQSFSLKVIDSFFSKIKDVPQQQFDEKHLNFLREFTKTALDKTYREQLQQFQRQAEAADGDTQFDAMLTQKEYEVITKLTPESIVKFVEELEESQQDYGIKIFWQILQDESPHTGSNSQEMQQLALDSLRGLTREYSFRKHVRLLYLLKGLVNILQGKSVVQSISVVQAVIDSIDLDQHSSGPQGENAQDDLQDEGEELEQKQGGPGPVVVLCIDNQLKLVDALIGNIKGYHEDVKQKCKKAFQKSGTLPDNLDEHIFTGKYSHSVTLQSILDLLEFLVCKSQQDSNTTGDRVTLGIENIKKLWALFVNEPNFQADQTLFINWVNKTRSIQRYQQQASVYQYQQPQMIQVQVECFLFTEAEKKFLFTNVLCNPQEVDASQISINLVRCWISHFKFINQAENQSLLYDNKRIRVRNFENLQGLNALWEIATKSSNEKAKEASQELLVDLHLRLDRESLNMAYRMKVIQHFINRCMEQLKPELEGNDKRGIIQLLSTFLDRFEGIRPLKPELLAGQRFPQQNKFFSVNVLCAVDPDNKIQGQVQTSFFQTFGFLRRQIAEYFGLEINQFVLWVKNNLVDPDEDDDRYVKDHAALLSKAVIKRNPDYDPQMHPKYLLAENQENFDAIFQMLQGSSPKLCEAVWSLINKLPQNKRIIEDFEGFKFLGAGQDAQQAWSAMIDSRAVFKLLYCLGIMTTHFLNIPRPQPPQQDENDPEDVEAMALYQEAKEAHSRQQAWKDTFIQQGGFQHLLTTLVELKLDSISSMLELECISSLTRVIWRFVAHFSSRAQALGSGGKSLLELQPPGLPQKASLRVVQYIDMICKFSLQEEQSRGESHEEIQRKIEASRQAKLRQRLRMTIGRDKGSKNNGQDDDEDPEDKKALAKLEKVFTEQASAVRTLLDFVRVVHRKAPEAAEAISSYPELEQMLLRGALQTENPELRELICARMREGLAAERREQDPSAKMLNQRILNISLFKILAQTEEPKYERRCQTFYSELSDMLEQAEAYDLNALEPQAKQLISDLAQKVTTRPVKENSSQDQDVLLWGYLSILAKLLQRFPQSKKPVGEQLTQYLVHDCLFEIPHGNKNAPKCKSYNSRRAAYELLTVLSRDCLENLQVVIDYMKNFNRQPTWRTNKDSDWKITLYDDEKSSTGRVGIKNLGCICYMNSLNQQLFMIPGFRNDVLSVKDPNHDKNPDEDNMFLQWQTLFAGLLLSEKMYVNPKGYCHAFKDWEGQPVNVIEQMDAEEYLAMFLDRLETAIKGTPQEKTIQHHFGGEFANEIICKTCPHQYERPEPFLTVGVPVKDKRTLQEGFQALIQGDMLQDQDQYQCEKCDKKVDALKRTCLRKLPRYMITTLKRFEFDFDRMIRVKLNDYFEFQNEIDVSPYTQEYLNKKEKREKEREEKVKAGEAEEEEGDDYEIPLQYPKEYYQYELVGAVVHSGTAESGHYYSYIKEQETARLENGKEKWYEFNDIWVRDFDPEEIPSECFGGEEQSFSQQQYWGGQQRMMKLRNAYILVYKRKLEDDSDLAEVDEPIASTSSAEIVKQDEVKVISQASQLGRVTLELDETNNLYQQVSRSNHKYWQNRFLFGNDYQWFVSQILLYWNTSNIIPSQVSWRNDDYHLQNQQYAALFAMSKQPAQINPISDMTLDISQTHNAQQIADAKLSVFKFAAQFYVTILQRSADKTMIPEVVRHLKAYINEDVRCAQWLVNEFVNIGIIMESLLQNSVKIMRRIMSGLLICAMLKLYEHEKDQLCFYFEDQTAGVAEPRQTTLGRLILTMLYLLPQVKEFNRNHSQFFQLIARFAQMGAEARKFLLLAGAIERLLNYFHLEFTPYKDQFMNAPPFDITETDPEMGLPTPEDPTAKKSRFAMIRENQRVLKLKTQREKSHYLLEALSYCIRCLHVESEFEIPQGQKRTPYELENLNFKLQQNGEVLFFPSHEFIAKVFYACSKTRAAVKITEAYMHWCYHDTNHANKLWETVQFGLKSYDVDRFRPYLVLFQHMLQAQATSQPFQELAESWLNELFTEIIPENQGLYQWMEAVIDWIIKVAHRDLFVRTWMTNNPDLWSYITDWLKQNPSPELQNQQQMGHGGSQVRLSRRPREAFIGPQRYNKQWNQVLFRYRQISLNKIKNNPDSIVSTENEIDVDQYYLDELKLVAGHKVTLAIDRHMHIFTGNCLVLQELDELVQIKSPSEDSPSWEPTDKGRLIFGDLYQQTQRAKDLQQLDAQLTQRRAQERRQREAALERQRWEDQEDDESSEDPRQAMARAQQHARSGIGTGARNAARVSAQNRQEPSNQEDTQGKFAWCLTCKEEVELRNFCGRCGGVYRDGNFHPRDDSSSEYTNDANNGEPEESPGASRNVQDEEMSGDEFVAEDHAQSQ